MRITIFTKMLKSRVFERVWEQEKLYIRVAGPTRRTPTPVDAANGKALFPERCLGQSRKTTILSFTRGGQSPRGACHFDVLVRLEVT